MPERPKKPVRNVDKDLRASVEEQLGLSDAPGGRYEIMQRDTFDTDTDQYSRFVTEEQTEVEFEDDPDTELLDKAHSDRDTSTTLVSENDAESNTDDDVIIREAPGGTTGFEPTFGDDGTLRGDLFRLTEVDLSESESESDQGFDIVGDDTDLSLPEGQSNGNVTVSESSYINNDKARQERRARQAEDMDSFVFDEGYDTTDNPYDRVIAPSRTTSRIPDGNISLSGTDALRERSEDSSAPLPFDDPDDVQLPSLPPVPSARSVVPAPVDRRFSSNEPASEATTEGVTELAGPSALRPRAKAVTRSDELATEQSDRQVGWKRGRDTTVQEVIAIEGPTAMSEGYTEAETEKAPGRRAAVAERADEKPTDFELQPVEVALTERKEAVEAARAGVKKVEERLAKAFGDGSTEKPSRSPRKRGWMAAGLAALALVIAGGVAAVYKNTEGDDKKNDVTELQADADINLSDAGAVQSPEDAARLRATLFSETPVTSEPAAAELRQESPELFSLDGFFDIDEELAVAQVNQKKGDTGLELIPSGEDAEFNAWLETEMPELVIDAKDIAEPVLFDDWQEPAEFMHNEERVMAEPWYEDDRYIVNNEQGFSQVMLDQRPDASIKDVRDTLKKYNLYYKGVNTRGKDQLRVLWGEDNSLHVYIDGVDVTNNLDKYTYDLDTDSYAEADTVPLETKDGIGGLELDNDLLDWFEDFDISNPEGGSDEGTAGTNIFDDEEPTIGL